LQPFKKFCDGKSVAAEQINSLRLVHNFTQKIFGNIARFTKYENGFGGAMILLAGDFCQTLPVIPRSTTAEDLNACLKSSILWKDVKMLKLNINTQVEL